MQNKKMSFKKYSYIKSSIKRFCVTIMLYYNINLIEN